MSQDAVKAFRDRLGLTISDAQLAEIPYLKPEPDSAAAKYITATRTALGGYIPARFGQSAPLTIPELSRFDGLLKGSGERNMSTTMAFVNILGTLLKDVNIGKLIVPIVPDESRTFGMEGLFRQIGIHSWLGQLYTPQDAGQLSYYKEAKDGQILQEGINESGAISTWIAAGTAYSNHDVATIPFYIFYSMFGLQRVGDLAWAAADARTKGFLLGATSGRTTLMGEGLQHDDGHSHVLSSVIPSCVSYDPTYAYELAVIVQSGMRRMFVEQEDIYYYITLLNEGYPQPPMPAGVEDGIIQGAYLLKQSETTNQESPRAQLVASGAIMREALAAAELLAADFGVASDIWSATSLSELRRNGMAAERWNLLHPEDPPKVPYIQSLLAAHPGPVVVVTDYMKIVGDQIKPFLPDRTFIALGTDGFGRSDTREALREFFEVNRHFIALAALKLLSDEGRIARSEVNRAMVLYGIAPDKPDPAAVK